MLSAMKPRKAMQAAVKGGADEMIAQIEALAGASPVTLGQEKMFHEIDSLARPLNGTVLEQPSPMPKAAVPAEEDHAGVMREMIERAAEQRAYHPDQASKPEKKGSNKKLSQKLNPRRNPKHNNDKKDKPGETTHTDTESEVATESIRMSPGARTKTAVKPILKEPAAEKSSPPVDMQVKTTHTDTESEVVTESIRMSPGTKTKTSVKPILKEPAAERSLPPVDMQVKTSDVVRILRREVREDTAVISNEETRGDRRKEAARSVVAQDDARQIENRAKSFGKSKPTEKVAVLPSIGRKTPVETYDIRVKRYLKDIAQEVGRRKAKVKKEPFPTADRSSGDIAEIETVSAVKEQKSAKQVASKQVHLAAMLDQVAAIREGSEDASEEVLTNAQTDAQSGAQTGAQTDASQTEEKASVIQSIPSFPMPVRGEKKAHISDTGTAGKSAASLVQQIERLGNVEPMSKPHESLAPETQQALTPIAEQRQTPSFEPKAKPQGEQQAAGLSNTLPEEIATAVQWIAEEEVEDRLVEILRRQAKLRGIDLS